MYIAKCISESIPFLGQFKTMSGRVLYINAEMSESEMQRRGKLLGIEENNINIYFLNRDDFNIYAPTNAVDTIDYKWLLQYVYQNKIDVVVVDTFRAVAGGLKEEQAGEVRTMFKKLNILKNSGVSVIVLDHYRKPSNFDRKVPKKEHLFGSVDKVANAEILLMLRNEGNGEMHLYQTKNRLSKEMDPFIVRMEDFTRESGEPGVRFVYIGKLEEKESKKDEAKEMILSALVDGGRTRPDIIAMLRESKIGEKNISDALRELEKAQTIDSTQQGHRKFYFLPQVKDVDLSEMDTIIPQEEG
jgi:hypothetical protein